MLKKTFDGPDDMRPWRPFIRDTQWRPPAGYVRLLERLQMPLGRPYGAKVIVAKERTPRDGYLPGLVGRIVEEGYRGWKHIGEHELLVDFGRRGIVALSRDRLRLDQD